MIVKLEAELFYISLRRVTAINRLSPALTLNGWDVFILLPRFVFLLHHFHKFGSL